MVRSLYTAATGMVGQQTQIDTTTNNISNVNTIGYKKQRAEFADLMYQTMEHAGTSTSNNTQSPTGIQVGLGTRPTAIAKMFSQGNFKETGNNLDVAIAGQGFFQIETPNGEVAYSRNGSFKVDQNGTVVNSDGYPLIPEIVVPEDTTDLSIGSDGTVSVMQAGQQDANEIGQIQLVNFVNPAGLHGKGDNLYSQTPASGDAIIALPGEDGTGQTKQGFVEMSNVQLVDEMTDLITGQRAYEANSKAITTSDEMLQTVNQLKR
ncbi:MAG: flagellar basal-body rod protein FlgG [Campylobacterota bacterium]